MVPEEAREGDAQRHNAHRCAAYCVRPTHIMYLSFLRLKALFPHFSVCLSNYLCMFSIYLGLFLSDCLFLSVCFPLSVSIFSLLIYISVCLSTYS